MADTDDTLILVFMCCHPALSTASQIAITLRAVGGLNTVEIARAFLVPEATMTRRITRAKQTIKDSHVPFRMPAAAHGLVLLTLSGIGQVSAARFDLNQEALHDLAGLLGIVCLSLAAMLISLTLAGTPRWVAARKPLLVTANLTWLTVVVWVGTFALMIATFLQTPGGLPTTLAAHAIKLHTPAAPRFGMQRA